jgi:biopolymer transport protein ExbD
MINRNKNKKVKRRNLDGMCRYWRRRKVIKKTLARKEDGNQNDMILWPMLHFLLLLLYAYYCIQKAQTLNKLPPSSTNVQIAASNLLTLRIDEDNRIFQSIGLEKPNSIEFSKLGDFFKEKAAVDPNMIILVKLDRKTKYHFMVDVIDELNLAKIPRYSVATLSDIEKEELAKIQYDCKLLCHFCSLFFSCKGKIH